MKASGGHSGKTEQEKDILERQNKKRTFWKDRTTSPGFQQIRIGCPSPTRFDRFSRQFSPHKKKKKKNSADRPAERPAERPSTMRSSFQPSSNVSANASERAVSAFVFANSSERAVSAFVFANVSERAVNAFIFKSKRVRTRRARNATSIHHSFNRVLALTFIFRINAIKRKNNHRQIHFETARTCGGQGESSSQTFIVEPYVNSSALPLELAPFVEFIIKQEKAHVLHHHFRPYQIIHRNQRGSCQGQT